MLENKTTKKVPFEVFPPLSTEDKPEKDSDRARLRLVTLFRMFDQTCRNTVVQREGAAV